MAFRHISGEVAHSTIDATHSSFNLEFASNVGGKDDDIVHNERESGHKQS